MELEKNPFEQQIQDLLNQEKTARINTDTNQSLKITEQIIKIAYELQEFDRLFELLKALCTKRGQAKKVQSALVTQCMGYLNSIDNEEKKIQFILAIKEVCDKKIHLEVEYARCCLMLVKHKEDEKELQEAARILQDVQVETYGTMDRREKVEFILYQMKIQLKKRDFIRLAIVSRKINPKNLNEAGILDLKVLFYSYMIALHINDQKFIEVATCFKQIFDTLNGNTELREKIPAQIDFDFETNYIQCLENFILFLSLSSHCPEQVNLLNELRNKYAITLEKHPHVKNIVDSWLLDELISTDMESYKVSNLYPFKLTTARAEEHIIAFKKQLVQHNLRIVHKYYKRIHINRLVQLLNVSADVIEIEICDMINNKLLYCKIDRVDGIFQFRAKRNQNEILEDWTNTLGRVLELIDETSNLIKREQELII